MAEPITLSLAALGIGKFIFDNVAGSVVGSAGEGFFNRKFLDPWRERMIAHPLNHDLEGASKKSLRSAGLLLVIELAGRIDPGKSWLNRKAERLPFGRVLTQELLPSAETPEGRWLNDLRRAIESDEKLTALHDSLKFDEAKIRECFADANLCHSIGPLLTEKFRAWANEAAQGAPSYFEALVREGWRLDPEGNDAERITLADAYCAYFREHLKTDARVFRILVTDTLTQTGAKLNALGAELTGELQQLRAAIEALAASPTKIDFTAFEEWLEPQLGKIKQLLGEIKDALDALARSQESLREQQTEILATLTSLRAEILRNNRAVAQPALDDLSSRIKSKVTSWITSSEACRSSVFDCRRRRRLNLTCSNPGIAQLICWGEPQTLRL